MKNDKIHNNKINDLVVIQQRKYVISASVDCYCIISDLESLKFLHLLSFKPDINASNFIFRSLEYDGQNLYSLLSPLKGSSYITKWNVRGGFSPELTKKISDESCISMRRSGDTMMVGSVNGSVIHVDKESFDVVFNKTYHVLAVKEFAIVNQSVCYTCSPDKMISSHLIRSKGVISGFSVLLFLLFSIFIYALFLRIEQLKVLSSN